jgi:hypothetical protein
LVLVAHGKVSSQAWVFLEGLDLGLAWSDALWVGLEKIIPDLIDIFCLFHSIDVCDLIRVVRRMPFSCWAIHGVCTLPMTRVPIKTLKIPVNLTTRVRAPWLVCVLL